MINLTQEDIDVRLQMTNCCIADKTNILLNKIKIGSSDANCKLQELEVLQGMMETLKCYKTSDQEGYDDNCLTEIQAQSIFDYISTKCDICFQRPGFNYTS